MTERPPYEAYATILGVFATALAGATALSKVARKPPPDLSVVDLVALGGATFKGAHALTRERVGSFIRAPFVEGEAGTGEHERPAGDGFHQAIGELVTCSRCIGTWVAAGLGSSMVLTPRFGRLLVWCLNASAINDFLQAAFRALCATANTLEEGPSQARARAREPAPRTSSG